MSRNVILTINPGTTTTRCALFSAEGSRLSLISEQSLGHEESRMAEFSGIADQLGYRSACVAAFLGQAKGPDDRLIAIAGRGGMLTPVPAGVILINDELVDFALHTPVYDHASNLGAPLAHAIAAPLGIPAYIVDPVSVDELTAVARLSGFEEIPRFSFVHALNIRACGRKLAGELCKPFDELRAVVAHLGAGFSIATLLNGKIVDSSNRMEISPFTPERAGGLPPLPLIELCYSRKYDKPELLKKLYGEGGVYGYLGTKDIRKIESRIAAGDAKAALVYDAMLYQIRKAIGAMASIANFELDGVILTGGLANSTIITDRLIESAQRIAPVAVYPGSNECLALAEGILRVLDGQEMPMTWPVTVDKGVVV